MIKMSMFEIGMKIKIIYISLVIIILSSNYLTGQEYIPSISLETGTQIGGGKYSPFWFSANKYGKFSTEKFQSYIRVYATNDTSMKNLVFYGLDIFDRYDKSNNLKLHQAYLGFRYAFLCLYGGLKEEQFGNHDVSLSSGGLIWSGNAEPIPTVFAGIPEYFKVPFTFNLLEIKGGISHGWLTDDDYITGAWLHHKYIFLQLGGDWPIKLEYGIHHFAQWGGKSTDSTIGGLPSTFSDFLKVFTAKGGGTDAPSTESANSLGNHIGSRNYGLYIKVCNLNLKLYKHDIFEDNSGRRFKNIEDGLYGFSIRRHAKSIINGFLYEFLNTTDQSRKTHNYYWVLNDKIYYTMVEGGVKIDALGNDNYFNNGVYRSGWTNRKFTIGNPLVTSPVYGLNGNTLNIQNNKVKGHHFGIEGMYGNVNYKILYTYTLNYGSNEVPFSLPVKQNSFLVSAWYGNFFQRNLTFRIEAGIDKGSLYGDNLGFRLVLIKN